MQPRALDDQPLRGSHGAGASQTRLHQRLERSECEYAPFYCEENIYKLAQRLEEEAQAAKDQHQLFVIFISNRERRMEMRHQKIGQPPDGIVWWDYHVILLQCKLTGLANLGDGKLVWDLDSTLPFPVDLDTYRQRALLPPRHSPARRFRLVRYHDFMEHFASNRSHMLNPVTGQLQEAPPPWEPIKTPGGATMTLPAYLDMRMPSEAPVYPHESADYGVDMSGFGVVFEEPNFWQFFGFF